MRWYAAYAIMVLIALSAISNTCKGSESYESLSFEEAFQTVDQINSAVADKYIPKELRRPGVLGQLCSTFGGWGKTFLSYFTRREKLADNITADMEASNFLKMKLKAMELAVKEFPNDPVVAALVTSIENPSTIREALEGGISGPLNLVTYFDIASIVPNENALWLLLDELDVDKTHSKPMMSQLDRNDCLAISQVLLKPFIAPGLFARLFRMHPMRGRAAKLFLKSAMEQIMTFSPANFLPFLRVLDELSPLVSGFSIEEEISRFYAEIREVGWSPLNIVTGLLYLFFDPGRDLGRVKYNVINLLERFPLRRGQVDETLLFFEGLEAILSGPRVLPFLALSRSKSASRARFLTELVNTWDPGLDVIGPNSLNMCTEALIVVDGRRPDRGRPRKRWGPLVAQQCMSASLPETIALCWRHGLLYQPTAPQVETLEMLQKIKSLVAEATHDLKPAPCYDPRKRSATVTQIAIGKVLDPNLALDPHSSEVLISETLIELFGGTPSEWGPKPFPGTLDIVDDLNKRLARRCGASSSPGVEFLLKRPDGWKEHISSMDSSRPLKRQPVKSKDTGLAQSVKEDINAHGKNVWCPKEEKATDDKRLGVTRRKGDDKVQRIRPAQQQSNEARPVRKHGEEGKTATKPKTSVNHNDAPPTRRRQPKPAEPQLDGKVPSRRVKRGTAA